MSARDAAVRAVAEAWSADPIGWIVDDGGKPWPPMTSHAKHKYDGGCAVCRPDQPAALAVVAEVAVDAVLAALGGATDACTHESSTGVDQDFGPDKVWACDGCGWRHRTVVADGLARDVDA